MNEKEEAAKTAKLAVEKATVTKQRNREAMKERRRNRYREELGEKKKRLAVRGEGDEESGEQNVCANGNETKVGSGAPEEYEDDEEVFSSSEDVKERDDEVCPFDAINDKYGYVVEA